MDSAHSLKRMVTTFKWAAVILKWMATTLNLTVISVRWSSSDLDYTLYYYSTYTERVFEGSSV